MSNAGEFRSREAQTFFAGLAHPERVQQELLRSLLAANTECEFGRSHGFSRIDDFAAFQRAVPVAKYEAFEPAIERIVAGEQGLLTTEPVRRFFLTSGSMAKSKYVPVTSSFVRAKSRAFGIYWAEVFARHPEVRRGRMVTNFSDSGEAVRAPGSGLPCSSESAYWAGVTRATSLTEAPIIPKSVAQIGDHEGRYYTLARILLEEQFTVMMTLNPSTILLLFQKIQQLVGEIADDIERGGISERIACGDTVRSYIAERYRGNPARADELRALAQDGMLAHRAWPELRLAICWRSPMLQPYLELLAPHLAGVAARDYILMASEGVMAIPIDDGRSGGPLALGVHVYEFIPEDEIDRPDPTVLQPHQLEDGKTYVLVLTNGSGLWRYNIGDVVRVRGFVERTPAIEFLHRAGATCSLTGEKLTEDQVTAAIRDVARALELSVVGFTLAPARGGFPRYVAYVEFAGEPDPTALRAFPERLDDALEQHNIEYGGKRSSQRLAAPELARVRSGGYEARRRQRLAGGASDSQIKPTHLTRDPGFGDQFEVVERFVAG